MKQGDGVVGVQAEPGAPEVTVKDFGLDPGTAGWPLFRPLPAEGREAARRRMIEMDFDHDGRRLRVASPYTPGADDLRVLLALLAQPREPLGDGLERICSTLQAVCRATGIEPGEHGQDRVFDGLLRLAGIAYADCGPAAAQRARGMRLERATERERLFLGLDVDGSSVEATVNPWFARALLGSAFAGERTPEVAA